MNYTVEETVPPVYVEESNGKLVKLDLSADQFQELKERGATFRPSPTTRDGGLIIE